jgi:hypothetical protein
VVPCKWRALVKEGVFAGGADNATQELVRLADQRDSQTKALIYETGLDTIGEHDDKLGDLAGEALQAVQNYPVRTFADLIAKMEIEEAEGCLRCLSIGSSPTCGESQGRRRRAETAPTTQRTCLRFGGGSCVRLLKDNGSLSASELSLGGQRESAGQQHTRAIVTCPPPNPRWFSCAGGILLTGGVLWSVGGPARALRERRASKRPTVWKPSPPQLYSLARVRGLLCARPSLNDLTLRYESRWRRKTVQTLSSTTRKENA